MKFLPLFFSSCLLLQADPLISSWFTDLSGRYARIYPDNEAMAAQAPVTTWSRGQGVQNMPVYAGLTEISSTDTDLYIRTSNLGYHTMGPWYGDNGNLFPNYPANRAAIYRFPRTPVIPTSKTPTDLAVIGYAVDGIALFDSRDAFSYDTSAGIDEEPRTATDPNINGDGIWLRDAYTTEGATFDKAFAHQAGSNHHYHANTPALRHLLGDSVTYTPETNTYTEVPNGAHSPIIGWFRDGFPLYGPYGYSNPNDPTSPVRRMISGYQKRDGSNGSANIASPSGTTPQNSPTGRTTLPQWLIRNEGGSTTVPENLYGPGVSDTYPIGQYHQDYAYKGDLGFTMYDGSTTFDESSHFDLNEYNVRFCITPEFPAGTWAYFTNIEPDGTPVYPYNISRYYFGTPSGNTTNTVPADAIIHFEGGPKKEITVKGQAGEDDQITLVWSAIEGGEYVVDSSTTLETSSWKREAYEAELEGHQITVTEDSTINPKKFYRTKLTNLAPFDTTGLNGFSFTPVVTYVFNFATSPTLPDTISSVTIGGVEATVTGYDFATGFLEVCFDDSTLSPGTYSAQLNSSFTSNNTYNVAGANNVLLLILDDWGLDSSELYNTSTDPNVQLASMPILRSLLYRDGIISDTPDKGLLFTRGYSQPICSPTRATLLTGRQPFQHGVGNPGTNSTLPASEQTFPEIITAESPQYKLASFGKWHLGSGNTGPIDTGGWPNFTGTLQGGVPNYFAWARVKLENGTLIDSGTDVTNLVPSTYSSPYATSVQVDEASSFIGAQDTDPWVVWMGFNAPHLPFDEPPSELAPPGGYSTTGTADKDVYIRLLEALDTEIGRLLSSVDLSKTNIIVVGDNGTPGQVDQAPAGGLAGAKGNLGEGGIHVPFFATGPDVFQTGKTDKLVHVADLFSTVLDLTGVDAAATADIDHNSNSLVPIFQGIDTASRCIISEKFGDNNGNGRALISSNWPQYKLLSLQDVSDPSDTPTYQMFLIGDNGMEDSTLATPPLPGDPHEAAYLALLEKDQMLIPVVTVPSVIVNIQLPTDAPPLINPMNQNIVRPNAITIGGVPATWNTRDITVSGVTTSAARVDQNGNPDQFSVTAGFDTEGSGLTSGQSYPIIVSFPGAGGNSRTFTALNQYTAP